MRNVLNLDSKVFGLNIALIFLYFFLFSRLNQSDAKTTTSCDLVEPVFPCSAPVTLTVIALVLASRLFLKTTLKQKNNCHLVRATFAVLCRQLQVFVLKYDLVSLLTGLWQEVMLQSSRR